LNGYWPTSLWLSGACNSLSGRTLMWTSSIKYLGIDMWLCRWNCEIPWEHVPYLSASALVIHYEEALYQVYAPSPFTNALTHPIERSKTKVSEETSNIVLISRVNNDRAPARTKSITVTVVGRGTVLSHDDNECSRVRESSCTVDGALDLLHKAGAYSWVWPLQVLQLPIVHRGLRW